MPALGGGLGKLASTPSRELGRNEGNDGYGLGMCICSDATAVAVTGLARV